MQAEAAEIIDSAAARMIPVDTAEARLGSGGTSGVAVLTLRRRDLEPEPPIACTLTAADQADRIGEWRRLVSQADSREQVDSGLAFRLPAALAGQLAELTAAEQQCCPFLEFNLHLIASGLRFEVQVPESAAPVLADLFGTGDMPSWPLSGRWARPGSCSRRGSG